MDIQETALQAQIRVTTERAAEQAAGSIIGIYASVLDRHTQQLNEILDAINALSSKIAAEKAPVQNYQPSFDDAVAGFAPLIEAAESVTKAKEDQSISVEELPRGNTITISFRDAHEAVSLMKKGKRGPFYASKRSGVNVLDCDLLREYCIARSVPASVPKGQRLEAWHSLPWQTALSPLGWATHDNNGMIIVSRPLVRQSTCGPVVCQFDRAEVVK